MIFMFVQLINKCSDPFLDCYKNRNFPTNTIAEPTPNLITSQLQFKCFGSKIPIKTLGAGLSNLNAGAKLTVR